MAILSVNDLRSRIEQYVGERDDDDTLSFIQDVTETVADLDARSSSNEWEEKYNDLHEKYVNLDTDWRARYKKAFFEGSDENYSESAKPSYKKPVNSLEPREEEIITIDDLFTTKS